MRRRYQRNTNDADLRQERRLQYEESNRTYQAKLRQAKLKSWKDFCSGTQSSNPWNSVYWYAAGKIRGALTLSTLKTTNNTHTADIQSTLNQLMDYFIPEDSESSNGAHHKRARQFMTEHTHTKDDIPFTQRHSIYATRSTGYIGKVWLMEGSGRRCPNQWDTSSGLQDLPYLFHRSLQRMSTQRTLSTTLEEINNTPDSETWQGGTQWSAQIPPHQFNKYRR